ncbi:MAG: hypothetical protein IJW24_02355 [Clostridia bacterium]|nr:hypothetical protein [Clostridia bacterium]
MKKILLSIILCVCACFSFFFTGCSLVETDNSYKDTEVVMTVGDTEITRKELVDQYYSFYNQYYQYFMYYDQDTMMDLFYSTVENRTLVLGEAKKMLESGELKFIDDEYDEIWYKVFDNVDSQLDTIEKALRLQAGTSEDDLPEWLKDDEDEETAYVYKPYDPTENKIEAVSYVGKTSATMPTLASKIEELQTSAIYKYVLELDEDKPRDEQEKQITEQDDKVYRDVAFTRYIDSLMIAAKAEGEDSSRSVVLEKEMQRLFDSYYDSALYTKYQEYQENNGVIDDELLSDDKIVAKFVELVSKDTQANSSEDAYVEVITSSSNESLVLYHNNGEYKYFTVQHILVKFEDATLEKLKEHEGYDAKLDNMFREEYEALRQELAGASFENLWGTYRDAETGLTVKEDNGSGEMVDVKVTASEILLKVGAIVTANEGNPNAIAYEFNKLAWQYSADTGSLTEKLSAKLGFTISSEADNHGSYVSDFADGARELYDNGAGTIGDYSTVLSDYGLHIMMLTDVYNYGAIVDYMKDDGNGKMILKSTAEIIGALKNKKVSNMTEQTLYDYFYDMIKSELVGDNGTYFTKFRNKLVADYKEDGKISYEYKMTYEELSEAIGY